MLLGRANKLSMAGQPRSLYFCIHVSNSRVSGLPADAYSHLSVVFGATWLTVPWLYPTEIFPLECRARGNSWGTLRRFIRRYYPAKTRPLRRCRMVNWKWLAYTFDPRHVQRNQREDAVCVWGLQCIEHSVCVGVLPRDESADA